ncbi:hypothetical protein D9613_008690 [Agrocybe pediades]|uniref:Uncharacterized protein n=1 Tax=Agrocybe pediades TaxID=84607 RepID=A0A8H4QSM5_9AGAR|nr:hypothetical protein D9613_008690 [Agrocybe pediades]
MHMFTPIESHAVSPFSLSGVNLAFQQTIKSWRQAGLY